MRLLWSYVQCLDGWQLWKRRAAPAASSGPCENGCNLCLQSNVYNFMLSRRNGHHFAYLCHYTCSCTYSCSLHTASLNLLVEVVSFLFLWMLHFYYPVILLQLLLLLLYVIIIIINIIIIIVIIIINITAIPDSVTFLLLFLLFSICLWVILPFRIILDAASLRTTAKRVGDSYILNGSKVARNFQFW